LKNKNSHGVLYSCLRGIKRGVCSCRDRTRIRLWSALLRRRPIDSNKIVFSNFLGRGFGDNPKYIALELLRRDPTLDLVWAVSDPDAPMPEGIRTVRYGSFAAAKEWATAAVWVDNVRNTLRPRKKAGQLYLQAWHGPFSGKRVEMDAQDTLSADYIRSAKYDGSIADGFIANCAVQAEQIRRAFWIGEHTQILPVGMPRNDFLVNNARQRTALRAKHGLDDGLCCVLYAPTFRDDLSADCYDIDPDAVLDAFRQMTGRECRLIIRLHPNVARQGDMFDYSDTVINGSLFPDIQELAVMCDYLISDYSSCVFDFMLLDKPAFVYTPDLERYEQQRGLLEDFYRLPFPLSRSRDELTAAIRSFDRQSYDEGVRSYREQFPTYSDGHSSERAADWILSRRPEDANEH